MCLMNFAINGYTKEYMSIIKDGLGVEYTGKKELLEYEIQLWDSKTLFVSVADRFWIHYKT